MKVRWLMFFAASLLLSCNIETLSNTMLGIKKTENPTNLSYTPNLLITGKAGSGKTSFLNKLCGTNKPTGKGKSITRELFFIPVNCGNFAMNLVDTPGVDSKEERFKHGSLFYHALTTKAYNAILTVIPFNDRYEKMSEAYDELVKPYKNYEKNVVILVSKFGEVMPGDDEVVDFNIIKKDIIEEFESKGIFNNVIFYSKLPQCKPGDISNMIYSTISNLPLINMSMSREDFNFAFDIYMPEDKFKEVKLACEAKMRSIELDFLELVKYYENDSERDDILQYLSLVIKDELVATANEFNKKITPELDEFNSINFQIYLHAKIIQYTDSFINKIAGYMKWKFMDKDDVRNFIKRCPKCKEVWIRTEGCDGDTDCGNFKKNTGTFGKDVASSWWFKFDLVWNGGKPKIKKLPEPKVKTLEEKKNLVLGYIEDDLETPEEKFKRLEREKFEKKAVVKRQGCGTAWKFSDLPCMETKELLELFKVDSLETLKDYVKSGNKTYQYLVDKYESSIDKDYKS